MTASLFQMAFGRKDPMYSVIYSNGKFVLTKLTEVQDDTDELIIGEYQTDFTRTVLNFFDWSQIASGEIFDNWMCNDCGEFYTSTKHEIEGDYICEGCYDENYSLCGECATIHHVDCLTYCESEDRLVCHICLEDHYSSCDRCGEYIRTSNSISDCNYTLCHDCYDNYYSTCDNCGDIIHNYDAFHREDEVLCSSCYERSDSGYIHDYDYTPSLDFKGDGTLHFGVEMEIDRGDIDSFNFDKLSRHFYCKHDGSLDEGFEIVCHPMTYDWMVENTPFKNPIALAKEAGFKAHETTTCGLHVHMSRIAFGDGDVADQRITSFIFFFEKFWKEIVQFSRRNPLGGSIQAYAARYCDDTSDGEPITFRKIDDAKKQKRFERYQCVNLTNRNTIEVRIFRGTLNENTIIASIQLCKLFHELSVFDIPVLENMTWSEVKKYAETDYPELVKAFEKRNL